MAKIQFPPVDNADEDGLLGIGGDLTVENLLMAYKLGIFPWPWSEEFIAWFSPPQRAVLFLKDLVINRSLSRCLKQNKFTFSFNNNFDQVIKLCQQSNNRKNNSGTWITPAMVNGYTKLHQAGYAQSFEAYYDNQLVGGMYGVRINNYFSAESMFYLKDNASKCALIYAFNLLQTQGVTWIDCQVLNDTTFKLGALQIGRSEFNDLLSKTISG